MVHHSSSPFSLPVWFAYLPTPTIYKNDSCLFPTRLSSFRCAKCGSQVETDSNLLLLSDGSPVCENCSYSCHKCNLPIRDEAIMTGMFLFCLRLFLSFSLSLF